MILRNGVVVTPESVQPADIAVEDGRIVAIAPELPSSGEEIDARGLHILPGVIDIHVHFNEPGRADWEGAATGSCALAAGGGTVFFDMPLNSAPCTVGAAEFDAKRLALEQSSITDFALWGGIVPGNPLSGFVCAVRFASRLVERMLGCPICEDWIEATLQSDLAVLTRQKIGHDGTVPGDHHVQGNIRLVFDVNDLMIYFRLLPAGRGLVFTCGIELLDKQVLNIGIQVGKTPGDALIVANKHKWHSWQADAGHVEITRMQLDFIPNARKLVAQVHIIAQKRFAANRVRPRNHPVV